MIGFALSVALLSQQVTQTCGTEMGQWVCRSPQAPSLDYNTPSRAATEGLANGIALGQAMRAGGDGESRDDRLIRQCAERSFWFICSGREREEARALGDARAARDSLRQDVMQLLAADDCPSAIRAALNGGDMDLAREARDFCRP